MRAWVVRGGGSGEFENYALENDVAVVGWPELGNLSGVSTRSEMRQRVRQTIRNISERAVANNAGQLLRFAHVIERGDLVVMPCKTTRSLAFGRCGGPYDFRPNNPPEIPHTRPVEWIRTEVPRHEIDQDLLHSLGSLLTVFEVKRNDAAARLAKLLRPGPNIESVRSADGGNVTIEDDDALIEDSAVDVELLAADGIETHISRVFRGHRLAELVEAVLRAEGYVTRLSPPGPDGGVDVLVGSGPLGLEVPRIAVQVKSGHGQVNAPAMRDLQGAAHNFGADTALFVSWGGFNRAARKLATEQWFQLRIWDSGTLIEKITENYDRLPEQLQAQLPLKQVWTLAVENDE